MESLIREWDGESMIIRFDRIAEAFIIIAVHSIRLGPAIGGTRMKQYPDLDSAVSDAQRLAGGMTYKWAASGLDAGGGKAVISLPSDLDPKMRDDLLRRYGAAVKQLNGLFLTGPDLGTTSEDMDVIAESGDPYIFCKSPDRGGTGNPGPLTALGVYTSIQAAARQSFGEATPAGKRVLVQGLGSVGQELVKYLHKAGAEILISDVNETIIQQFKEEFGFEIVPPDAVYDEPCDIFAPCALGGILNQQTIQRLRCRAIAGAANNQLEVPEDSVRLKERQILYTPDFIANSGGIIGVISMETKGLTRKAAEEKIVRSITDNLSRIFKKSSDEDITTDDAAKRLADERLK